MDQEQLEFAISQYLDGTLAPAEQQALERRLEADPQARALLDEYRALNGVLLNALPAPAFDYDRFSNALRAKLAHEVIRQPGIIGRIGPVMRIAVAACAAIAVTLFVTQKPGNPVQQTGTTGSPIASVTVPTGTLTIAGPAVELAEGAPIIQIAISAAPSLDHYASYQSPAREALAQRPARIMIASGQLPAEDIGSFSF